ncbi:transporter [Phenylobacterium sp.]|uniref:transporter n=1 Tax=Phenylobacterium sp. TaxID=1871053 RepID=UPI0035AF383E
MKPLAIASLAAWAAATAAVAHDGPVRADAHAPIGIMGDHTHHAGEFMFSYRFMHMDMKGSLDGTDDISPQAIVTSVANPNAPPATLRVAPLKMGMDMHMFGAMWAPSDRVTLMAMTSYVQKDMDHLTFQGMSGTTQLGTFTARSEGFGDTRVIALISVAKTAASSLHVQAGVSAPTGSIDKSDQVLTPMNTRPTLTLPYAMQLGSGTWDPILGVTVRHKAGDWTFGGQANAIFRVAKNDRDYALGDEFNASAWAAWSPAPAWSFSARTQYASSGGIDGRDTRITAPVQTADPANYGGERLDLYAGVNWVGQSGALRGQRFAAEIGAPIYQDLNGPQLKTGWTLMLGWQYAPGGMRH